MNKRNSRGQNIIEYLLVTAVVILICVAFFNPSDSPGRRALENITNDIILDMDRLDHDIVW